MLDFRLQPENLTKEGIFKIEGTSETLSNQYFKDLIFNKNCISRGVLMNMKSAHNGPGLVNAQITQISCFFIVANPVEHVDLNHVRLKF